MNDLFSVDPTRFHRGFSIPTFFYGTAWKEEKTETLVRAALDAGFRAIDTANQRRHYHEAGVGAALKAAINAGQVRREDLFVQTKFSYVMAQDHRMPYDPEASHADQVQQSLESSLEHLGAHYLDALILHGPSVRLGLARADWEVWRRMEQAQRDGTVRLLGVSNIGPEQLELLIEDAAVRPAFVQNRCFARTGWDVRVRQVCNAHDIVYQGFSLLTANAAELNQPVMYAIARQKGRSLAQVVFRFCLQSRMIPLTGTTDPVHMREDLAVYDFELDSEHMHIIQEIAAN